MLIAVIELKRLKKYIKHNVNELKVAHNLVLRL